MSLWVLLILMGLITYSLRLAFILLLGRLTLPPLLLRALRFVPPAVLSAVALPEVFRPHGVLDLSPLNPRLLAGIVAAVVAWRTRSVLLTIAAGMAVLWILTSLPW